MPNKQHLSHHETPLQVSGFLDSDLSEPRENWMALREDAVMT